MPHALLLSGSLGQGHDVMAEACADTLRGRGGAPRRWMRWDAGRGGATVGEALFRRMLALPGLYDAFHFSALRPGTRIAMLGEAAARSRLVPRLRGLLAREPADLIVSVFATAASAVNQLRAESTAAVPHLVFCTDVTPHRLWVQEGTDLFLVTSEVAACAVRRYCPDASIAVVPAPLRPGFYQPPSRSQARAEFGIPDQARCVLLMSGAWGLGPVAEAAAALGDAGPHVMAVAGRNQRLETRLLRRAHPPAGARPGLHRPDTGPDGGRRPGRHQLRRHLQRGPGLGRRLLLLDVVQGHGRDNLQHELELGYADVTSARPHELVRNALAALADTAWYPEPSPERILSRAPWRRPSPRRSLPLGVASSERQSVVASGPTSRPRSRQCSTAKGSAPSAERHAPRADVQSESCSSVAPPRSSGGASRTSDPPRRGPSSPGPARPQHRSAVPIAGRLQQPAGQHAVRRATSAAGPRSTR